MNFVDDNYKNFASFFSLMFIKTSRFKGTLTFPLVSEWAMKASRNVYMICKEKKTCLVCLEIKVIATFMYCTTGNFHDRNISRIRGVERLETGKCRGSVARGPAQL